MKKKIKTLRDYIPIPGCDFYKPIGLCNHSKGEKCGIQEDCPFKNNKFKESNTMQELERIELEKGAR